MLNGNWALNPSKNKFEPISGDIFTLFPTIVEPKKKIVYCRICHRWEYIVKFQDNKLLTQCGKIYNAPFVLENQVLTYGCKVDTTNGNYTFNLKSQVTSLVNRRTFENNYYLSLEDKVLYKNGKPIFENHEIPDSLCPEITEICMDEIGEQYKKEYGIKPSVASSLKSFNLLLGYVLCPFNINFYKICNHWGLNPYDKGFTYLSSGNTPTAESEMFDCLGIKPTKQIRKLYQKNPQSVICYSAVKDLGFTDVNILQKAVTDNVYYFFTYFMISFVGGSISYIIRESFKVFVTDMLAISNEKTVWNSVERTINLFAEKRVAETILVDGINLYSYLNTELTNAEKKEIMKEGFNTYTHDFLNRRGGVRGNSTYEKLEERVVFDIEQQFLDLEYKTGKDFKIVYNPKTKEDDYIQVPDKERYCFYVARDSNELKLIGSAMHNCVGFGYKNSVKERRCTIVYARHDNKYKICIEVLPNFEIRQALGPCNAKLTGDALEAYKDWCHDRNIQFMKAFSPRGAL